MVCSALMKYANVAKTGEFCTASDSLFDISDPNHWKQLEPDPASDKYTDPNVDFSF